MQGCGRRDHQPRFVLDALTAADALQERGHIVRLTVEHSEAHAGRRQLCASRCDRVHPADAGHRVRLTCRCSALTGQDAHQQRVCARGPSLLRDRRSCFSQEFRHKSVTSPVVAGYICGVGIQTYTLGLRACIVRAAEVKAKA